MPKGREGEYIPQHKRMAMGDMPEVSGNSGQTGFEKDKSGRYPPSRIKKSGTSTGKRTKGGY
jgi:hypothetical protein